MVTRWFAFALFLSASLLFSVEPLIGKMLTPLVGGAVAVWITAMLFFQALLLAGYVYAHASIRWLPQRAQVALHVALLIVAFFFLPIAIPRDSAASWPAGANPAPYVLYLLTKTVALPFFVLSASAPILQHWFSRRASERDPYYLYVASNLGSLLALAAYPLAIEPHFGLSLQTRAWRWGFVALVIVVGGCAAMTQRTHVDAHAAETPLEAPERIDWRRRLSWIFFAFVPSVYLLGVTAYVTQDVASLPLFWVLPLLLYLATFVLVFARRPPISPQWSSRLAAIPLTICVGVIALHANSPLVAVTLIHLASFFIAAMVCHGRLADDRPTAHHLTEFYLWLAVGGALGGVFGAVIAPASFDDILEYPLALVLAAACRLPRDSEARVTRADFWVPAILGATVVSVLVSLRSTPYAKNDAVFELVLVAAAFVNFRRTDRPIRFALGLGAIFLAASLHEGPLGKTIFAERNFYGVLRVTRDRSEKYLQIIDGDTVHGRQSTDPSRRRTPLAYYHPTGPLGDVMSNFEARAPRGRVALVGLGAGATTTFARAGESWDIYELNPAVVRLALDPKFFTYVTDAFPKGDGMHVVLGDARLELTHAPVASYDLIVLDAFSSDTIPVHLLTREAFDLYLRDLAMDGWIALHISNRFVDLVPVLAAVAHAEDLSLRVRDDRATVSAEARAIGVLGSEWVVLARSDASVASLSDRWKRPPLDPAQRVWTDDFSSVLSVFSRSER